MSWPQCGKICVVNVIMLYKTARVNCPNHIDPFIFFVDNSFIGIVNSCHICINFVWWLTLTLPSIWYCLPYKIWSDNVDFIVIIS